MGSARPTPGARSSPGEQETPAPPREPPPGQAGPGRERRLCLLSFPAPRLQAPEAPRADLRSRCSARSGSGSAGCAGADAAQARSPVTSLSPPRCSPAATGNQPGAFTQVFPIRRCGRRLRPGEPRPRGAAPLLRPTGAGLEKNPRPCAQTRLGHRRPPGGGTSPAGPAGLPAPPGDGRPAAGSAAGPRPSAAGARRCRGFGPARSAPWRPPPLIAAAPPGGRPREL